MITSIPIHLKTNLPMTLVLNPYNNNNKKHSKLTYPNLPRGPGSYEFQKTKMFSIISVAMAVVPLSPLRAWPLQRWQNTFISIWSGTDAWNSRWHINVFEFYAHTVLLLQEVKKDSGNHGCLPEMLGSSLRWQDSELCVEAPLKTNTGSSCCGSHFPLHLGRAHFNQNRQFLHSVSHQSPLCLWVDSRWHRSSCFGPSSILLLSGQSIFQE